MKMLRWCGENVQFQLIIGIYIYLEYTNEQKKVYDSVLADFGIGNRIEFRLLRVFSVKSLKPFLILRTSSIATDRRRPRGDAVSLFSGTEKL